MSISQINSQSMQLRAIAALRQTSAATPSSTVAPRQADSVELSEGARALTKATQSVSGTSDIREDRVAAIKAAIANGTYSVDSRTIAKAMVRTALK